jgi:hypothetical protein
VVFSSTLTTGVHTATFLFTGSHRMEEVWDFARRLEVLAVEANKVTRALAQVDTFNANVKVCARNRSLLSQGLCET